MPRAKENSYIFVSPSFVWPLQTCGIGVLLGETDGANAVTASNGAGGRPEVVDRMGRMGGHEGEDMVAGRVYFIVVSLAQTPSLPLPHIHLGLN